jgi:arsenate reductase
MSLIIYHNPKCSKSRATLALLRERGLEPQIIEYLKDPPSVEQLKTVLGMLGVGPRELLRPREAREAGLDDPSLSDEAILARMVDHPNVIERPIVIAGDRVRLGRPPESVLEIV